MFHTLIEQFIRLIATGSYLIIHGLDCEVLGLERIDILYDINFSAKVELCYTLTFQVWLTSRHIPRYNPLNSSPKVNTIPLLPRPMPSFPEAMANYPLMAILRQPSQPQ